MEYLERKAVYNKFTKEQAIEEYKKCEEDPVYFISKYVYVEHQLLGLVPFKLFPFQVEIIHALKDNRFNILRKFRQAGATTIACAYALWICVFLKNKTVTILSMGDTEAMDILARIDLMWSELPKFLQPSKTKGGDNKHNLEFTNMCKIKSRPSGKQSGRSLAAYFLIIDEGAFIDNIPDLWTAVYPIISTGGRVFALSTVNGMGGTGKWYFDKYTEATEGLNEFNPIDIDWKEHPQYYYNPDYEWLYEDLKSKDPKYNVHDFEKITKRNIGLKRWKQEYLAQFLGTGDTFIDGETLETIHKTTSDEYFIKYNNRMRVWREPDEGREYVMGVDVALGRERDYSAFHIFNAYNGEQVAEFYSNKTPINEFAEIVAAEASFYNTALVLCEKNSIGAAFLSILWETLEYENIWIDATKKAKRVMGWESTTKSKEHLMMEMEDWVRTNKILVNSERTVKELMSFIIDDNNKIGADEGQHDDLVIALGLSVKALIECVGGAPVGFSKIDNFHDTPIPMTSTGVKRPVKKNDDEKLAEIERLQNPYIDNYYQNKSFEDMKWVLGID